MAVATFPSAAEDAPHVSPSSKTTDVSKISLTAPMAFALMLGVGTVIGAFWTIRGADNDKLLEQMSVMSTAITKLAAKVESIEARDEELKQVNQKYLDQRFEALEAKIDAAGLRTANMALANELQRRRNP